MKAHHLNPNVTTQSKDTLLCHRITFDETWYFCCSSESFRQPTIQLLHCHMTTKSNKSLSTFPNKFNLEFWKAQYISINTNAKLFVLFPKKDLSLQNGYSCGHCTAKLLNEWSCKGIFSVGFKIVSIRLHLKASSCKSPCYILPCPKCQRNNSLSKILDRTIYNNDKCRLLSGKRTILEI